MNGWSPIRIPDRVVVCVCPRAPMSVLKALFQAPGEWALFPGESFFLPGSWPRLPASDARNVLEHEPELSYKTLNLGGAIDD